MRKLKLQMQVTVDGFIAGPKGEMDWMSFNWDADIKNYITEIFNPVDCIILGRKLAEGFIPYWADNLDEEGAQKINSTKKIVFTKTLQSSDWANTTLAKGDLLEDITRLKNEPGGDIIVYGGGEFVSSLIDLGLIDEFHFFINPAAIGKGMTIFNKLNKTQKLTLKNVQQFTGGIAVVCYDLAV